MKSVIAGRAVKSEYLAIGTLLTTGLAAWASSGGSKTAAPPTKGTPVTVPTDASKYVDAPVWALLIMFGTANLLLTSFGAGVIGRNRTCECLPGACFRTEVECIY